MTLYAQHGHGKSDKIARALDATSIDGVIFGARNEKPENVRGIIQNIRQNYTTELLFDPQFYVSTFTPPHDGYLPEYESYYRAGRTRGDFVSAQRLAAYARGTLDFQYDLGLDRLISPTVYFSTFDDIWQQIALNLADASLTHYITLDQPPPLLLSFVFAEQALDSPQELDGFLDFLTSMDLHGVYLIVAREDGAYSCRFDNARLAQLLYMVHVLGVVNSFEVVCGYSDFVGVPLRAAGATSFATGWNHSLRQFNRRSFIRREGGGRRPRLRYSSSPLFSSILLSELQQVYEIGQLDQVLSGVDLDEIITAARSPEASDWSQNTSDLHHWQALAQLNAGLSGDFASDTTQVLRRLRDARALFALLQNDGVVFEGQNDVYYLDDWIDAVRSFQRRVAGG